ncbi:MAG TPA: SRPBCC family protein [Pyrinomonadaceae bacterium]|jgi:ligand-binding SRPBCC domain-containing protein
MAEYVYESETEVPGPCDEVFDFFSKAENLQRITPPELGFQIITPLPIEMGVGTLIDYSISLHGIPLTWRTKITAWDPPSAFEDTQLSGPYKQWIHRHTFEDTGRGTTLMKDVVRYRLPLEPLGNMLQWLVHREIRSIFDFRTKTIGEIFKAGG